MSDETRDRAREAIVRAGFPVGHAALVTDTLDAAGLAVVDADTLTDCQVERDDHYIERHRAERALTAFRAGWSTVRALDACLDEHDTDDGVNCADEWIAFGVANATVDRYMGDGE
jgi:hypothetical protein